MKLARQRQEKQDNQRNYLWKKRYEESPWLFTGVKNQDNCEKGIIKNKLP